MDDVLIFGHIKEEHDARLETALRCIEAVGVILNSSLGKLKSSSWVTSQPDPDKMAAIAKMPRPTCVQELKRFMGMVNHLGKFSRYLAELSQPLHERKNNL